ncbi:MAG: patatin-like phospholipase family protein [Terriglobales bacterium]
MFSRRWLSLCTLCLLALFLAPRTQGQDQPLRRPRIGLVLSGGGARGLAHVGVLLWMEEHRIPVDYIAGTSMGGLVGAFYATGATAPEMRKFIEAIDWDDVLLSEPPYDQLSYRRKEDHRDYQVEIPLGLDHGLSAPNGFNPGHGIGLLLDRIVLNYSGLPTFDDLPIPFRCVATDLLKAKPLTLHDGSLAQALRATMAAPGVFTPVDRDGTVLADGGLMDNIPTDAAQAMGANLIIAVDVGTTLGEKASLNSISGVLTQTLDVMTIDNDQRSLRLADIVVTPDLERYNVTDYDQASAIISLGYQAAARRSEVLSKFALNEDEWQQHLAARYARKRSVSRKVDVVTVTGTDPADARRLQKRLAKKYAGRELNIPHLETDLTRIVGEGRFDSLGYEMLSSGGRGDLQIGAERKTYGPPFVNLAVNVSGSGVGDVDASAGVRITAMDIGGHGSEWRSDVLLGSSDLVASEFYQPLGTRHLFVAPSGFFLDRARNVFQGDTRIAEYRDRRYGTGLDLGIDSGRRSQIRFGYQFFNADLRVFIGQPTLPPVSGNTGQFRLAATFDGQDSPAVPSRGLRVTAELLHVIHTPGAGESFQQLSLRSSTFIPLSPKGSLFMIDSAGTSFRQTPGPLQLFSLGGPFNLGAYTPDEFLGNHYFLAGLGYRREIYRMPDPLGRLYGGSWYEAGSAFNDPNRLTVRGAFNAGLIANTIVGPVALFLSVSPTGHARVNFSLGRLF